LSDDPENENGIQSEIRLASEESLSKTLKERNGAYMILNSTNVRPSRIEPATQHVDQLLAHLIA